MSIVHDYQSISDKINRKPDRDWLILAGYRAVMTPDRGIVQMKETAPLPPGYYYCDEHGQPV